MSYQPQKVPFFLYQVAEGDIDKLRAYAAWFLSALPERISLLTKEVQSTQGYQTWKTDLSVQSLDALGKWLFERMHALEARSRAAEEILPLLQGWFFKNVLPEVHGITPDALFDRFQSWYLKALKTNPEQPGELAMDWFYNNVARGNVEGNEDLKIFEAQWKAIALKKNLDPLGITLSVDVGMYFSKVFSLFVRQNYPQVKWHPAFGNHKYKHYYTHVQVLENSENAEVTISFDPISAVIEIGFDMYEGKKSASALRDLYDLWVSCMSIYVEQLPVLEELATVGVTLKSIWEFRYSENPEERSLFPKAVPILCKHLQLPHNPYILEALAVAICNEDVANSTTAQAALDVLERQQLPRTVHMFLFLAAMQGNEAQKLQAQKYNNF